MSSEVQLSQLLVAHFDLCWVMIGVKGYFHDQPGPRSGVGDQVDDSFKARQGVGAPVLGDEAEQTMFNLVPFTGARWEVTDEQLDNNSLAGEPREK
jgi:hypothetical protein